MSQPRARARSAKNPNGLLPARHLELLALREYSAYELVQWMERSLQFYRPRAQSKLYEEPKKLVAAGPARSREEPSGRRTRTVYKITPAGRRALKRWLTVPGADPVLEFEALLETAFAEHGTLDGLRANLQAVLAEALTGWRPRDCGSSTC